MVRMGAGPAGLAGTVGANYHLSFARQSLEHWVGYDPLVAERELTFLRAQGFNTARTFLSFDAYEADRAGFLADLHHYAFRMAKERILFVPVLFDSFGEEPSGNVLVDANSSAWVKSPATATIAAPDFESRALNYLSDVVQTVNLAQAEVGDPGLWWLADLWNEPALATVSIPLLARLLGHLAALPGAPPATVGFARFADNEPLLVGLADPLDLAVLSGHPYGMFEGVVRFQTELAKKIGAAHGGRPILVSEVGLPGLFQDYGNVLHWLENAQVGFTLWEAFVGNNQFRNLTGIFYPEPAAEGFVTVRSTTAANALWALAGRRDPGFAPPHVARYRTAEHPGFVALGPGLIQVSTGVYHELLRSHEAHYGTPFFPWLDSTKPATLTLYQKLLSWTFLSLGRFLFIDPETAATIVADLEQLNLQYGLGNDRAAEAALLRLFSQAGEMMVANGAGEPLNYPPEVLEAGFEATVNPDGTFDARFEAVVFDLDVDTLTPRFFVHELDTNALYELPITAVENTSAFVKEVTGIPLTGGKSCVLAIFATDGRGAHALRLVPVALP